MTPPSSNTKLLQTLIARFPAWWRTHRKLVVFITGALLTFITDYYGPNNNWAQLATLLLTGVGVWGTPNEPLPMPAAVHGKHEGPGPVV
jgi:hypothetical protein